ncbi:MAG: hypothetical protein KC422_07165 [Trueperaceae bacterium]|nr:hypothetical protein [Trueperaceae bacterium]
MEELLGYLLDDPAHPLAQQVKAWLASSRRFRAFVSEFKPKIRKKLRSAKTREQQEELGLELETAYLLLTEKAFSLSYEPLTAGQGRAPDFAVKFTSSNQFFLEVTRLRTIGLEPQTHPFQSERFVTLIANKLGQLQAGSSNLLIIGIESDTRQPDLPGAMLQIQQRAEKNDPSLVTRYGFQNRKQFFQHYQRLSALVLRPLNQPVGSAPLFWDNPQTRFPLTSKIRTAVLRSQATLLDL